MDRDWSSNILHIPGFYYIGFVTYIFTFSVSLILSSSTLHFWISLQSIIHAPSLLSIIANPFHTRVFFCDSIYHTSLLLISLFSFCSVPLPSYKSCSCAIHMTLLSFPPPDASILKLCLFSLVIHTSVPYFFRPDPISFFFISHHLLSL